MFYATVLPLSLQPGKQTLNMNIFLLTQWQSSIRTSHPISERKVFTLETISHRGVMLPSPILSEALICRGGGQHSRTNSSYKNNLNSIQVSNGLVCSKQLPMTYIIGSLCRFLTEKKWCVVLINFLDTHNIICLCPNSSQNIMRGNLKMVNVAITKL
jgi:hypothetical protein